MVKHLKCFSNHKSGFSLIEVLAASVILLLVAGAVSQLSAYPKSKVIDLEKRLAVIGKLDDALAAFSQNPPFALGTQTSCSASGACDATVCTHDNTNACEAFTQGGICANAIENSDLTAIVQAYPTACYVAIILDPTIDDNVNSPDQPSFRNTQVGALAEWMSSQNQKTHEALTTYVFAT
ncbi:MAG: hypothetical protein COV74_08415 [Candidatus Omnitrophica bacterium CG11_big_fil_rev_8_21_14_0_20_45_26]|uniref:Uncharacterized protein n=1 Tax=Candidatus Abzuiibacterium crystallinum TaxID=1974748 RepID=A0A2H0LP93_9BACT|nr:MAG: hypothetical protein COV74_08415 [Candidatus Omnitrophica bacterium CG11_big_fil_rev_8_21_14_0_20_45_26]PIW63684.1 MAG: hypothetical protein COW12_09300 [Candidatus Omnitrophica bacterium CG12_big_fil_rev_8_21_14_0_65_45_16]